MSDIFLKFCLLSLESSFFKLGKMLFVSPKNSFHFCDTQVVEFYNLKFHDVIKYPSMK